MDKHINAPITSDEARKLHAGDYVYITGTIYTARDAAHKRMAEALSEGKELPYQTRMKQLKIEDLPLVDVAKKLGIKVQADLCGQAEGCFSPFEKIIRMNCTDK